MKLQRYDSDTYTNAGETFPRMNPDNDGEYVKLSDVLALIPYITEASNISGDVVHTINTERASLRAALGAE